MACGLFAGCAYRLIQRVQHPRQIALRYEHLPCLASLIARDNSAPLHHVDQPPGSGVADTQAALEHRGGGCAHLHDRGDGVAEEIVGVGVEVASESSPTPSTASSSSSCSSGSPCLAQCEVIF